MDRMLRSSPIKDDGIASIYLGGRKFTLSKRQGGVCITLCVSFDVPNNIQRRRKTNPKPTCRANTPLNRAPGLKFGFTGQDVAITFGPYTSPGVLIAYRVGGLDWQFTNITANATHRLVSPSTPGINTTLSSQLPLTFELRVTNWALYCIPS